MIKRSGKAKVRLVPRLSSYHSELQKRVAMVGVSLVIILILVGIGLYVAPGEFVGKAGEGSWLYAGGSSSVHAQLGAAEGSEQGRLSEDVDDGFDTYVETDLWNGAWGEAYQTGYCSGSNFCWMDLAPQGDTDWTSVENINEHCEDQFCNDDPYCYAAGSIIPASHRLYCAQTFESHSYAWLRCQEASLYTLTEDSTFICDDGNGATAGGYEWLQCTEEGEVRGEYRCDGDNWEECGDGSDYLCAGSESEQCNEDTQFDINNVGIDGQFYCSYTSGTNYQWVECTEETAGEGVDNADNANRYGDNYVCDGNSWEPINNCAACAGSLPGSCVGSGNLNFRTGEDESRYYIFPALRDSRIACVTSNECTVNGEEFLLDERRTSIDSVCGVDNTFLLCNPGDIAIPSPGGQWLCDAFGTWRECVGDAERDIERSTGTQIDNFICSFNAAENKWQWYSEFSCSPNQRYQVRDAAGLAGTDRICDGTNWITCADLAIENPFSEPGANVTCNGAAFSVKELICNNNADDDNDGLFDCDDQTMCSSTMPYVLNENHEYEVILKKGDCFTTNLDIDELAPVNYKGLNVCDVGTEQFGNRVTLCALVNSANTPILTLDSTTLLQNRFGQPYTDSNNLGFLFTESNPKTVSVMLSRDISDPEIPLELPLETFAPNFAAGQRVLLGVDGEMYLLWHPTVDATHPFGEQNLKLTHIATGTDIPAVVYPGTNRYTFDLMGDRLMTFLIDTPLVDPENQIFRIEALAPGEAPQSFPVPTDLRARFEVPFSKASPVRFTNAADSFLGTFSVCRDDNSADPQQVKVCRNGNLEFTLRARTLTAAQIFSPTGATVYNTGDTIPDNIPTSNNVYAFLFEVVNNTKQVSIFSLTSLQRTDSHLEYDPLINAMVSGRRVAVEFENKLYLLRHPVQPFISLPGITLTRYIGDVTTTFPALGSQDLIDFLASEGKINIHRVYGDPPPPFQISALRIEEIAPVALDRDLSTSMSSLVPVTVNDQLIRANDEQYSSDENVFRINVGGTDQLLHFHQPNRTADTLYYYRSVAPSGSQLVKQVSIYRLYDLSSASQSHIYDEDFRRALARGKEFAITVDDGETYYLVGYENNNNEVLSFNINRLRLFTLERTSTIPAIPDSGGIRFDLPNGDRVRFVVNYDTDRLEMQTGLELLTPVDFTGYMTELTPGTKVVFADGTTDTDTLPTEVRMHNLVAYASLTSAEISWFSGTVARIVEPAGVLSPLQTIISIEGQPYHVDTNGLTGNEKLVRIRKVLAPPLAPSASLISDWTDFITEIRAAREPLLLVSNRLYLPAAENTLLEQFTLRTYPGGTLLRTINLVRNTPISHDGSIVTYDRVLFIDQQETGNEERPVQAGLQVRAYYYLPDNREPLRFNATAAAPIAVPFVVTVDGTNHLLQTDAVTSQLVRLSLSAEQDTLLNRLFAAGETRVLNLGGVQVEIKVESIFNSEAQITIRRR